MSVFWLNIVGGFILLAGTSVLMYASYISSEESKSLDKQLVELKEATGQKAIAAAVKNETTLSFLKAIESGESIVSYFPAAFSYDIDLDSYDLLTSYFNDPNNHADGLGVLIVNQFPERAAMDVRIHANLNKLNSSTHEISQKFVRELICYLYERVVSKDRTSSEYNMFQRILFADFEGDPIAFLFNKFPNKRSELRVLVDEIVDQLGGPYETLRSKLSVLEESTK